MFYFAYPIFLLLLFLLPVILIGYGVKRHLRSRRMASLGDRESVARMMPSWSGAAGWWKVIFFCLGFGCFVLGLARPQMGAKLKEHKTQGSEIMICLDVSNSMLAKDYTPSRLERAKLAISRMVDKLEGDRVGLIIFAGTSFVQLPITADYVSAKMFLGTIDPEAIPVQGTALGDAINTAIRSFSAQSEKSRAIVVISDGENHEDDPVEAAKLAADEGIRVYAIGVGSEQGQPIPWEGGLLKDKEGNIVVTKLDEATLKNVARAGNGAYVRAGDSEFGLNPIIEELRNLEDEQFGSVVFEEYAEQFMYFFAAALLFFTLEALVGRRRSKRKMFS